MRACRSVTRIHRSGRNTRCDEIRRTVITFHSSTMYTIVNNRCTYIYIYTYVYTRCLGRIVYTGSRPNTRFTSWSSVLRRMFRRDVGHRSHSQQDRCSCGGSARAHMHARLEIQCCSVLPRSSDLSILWKTRRSGKRRRRKRKWKKKKKKVGRGEEKRKRKEEEEITNDRRRVSIKFSTIENTDAP